MKPLCPLLEVLDQWEDDEVEAGDPPPDDGSQWLGDGCKRAFNPTTLDPDLSD